MRLLISESQLEGLIAHINEGSKPKQVIEEGWKDVVYGAASLMGIELTGVNAHTAKNALDDIKTIKKIKSTLEGPNVMKVVDTLEKCGLKDAIDKVKVGVHKIKTNFDNVAKGKGLDINLSIINLLEL